MSMTAYWNDTHGLITDRFRICNQMSFDDLSEQIVETSLSVIILLSCITSTCFSCLASKFSNALTITTFFLAITIDIPRHYEVLNFLTILYSAILVITIFLLCLFRKKFCQYMFGLASGVIFSYLMVTAMMMVNGPDVLVLLN
ncbi:hypothetical protein RF11_13367 [Thelohanellus kitauei]|uniref:Uncharacterized protein n=1 Tax=Thelohanellus kitauei TaxID=669202 RepID=A0A0C2MVQ7_THEKT|nr:hypothetical protein RF11_13367 [Thelohanellus kitauei]